MEGLGAAKASEAVTMVTVIEELLRYQHGVIARPQALVAGITISTIRAHLDAGRWQRLLPGIYATFSGPVSRMARIWAALLWAGEGSVLSHETSAELHGFGDRHVAEVHVTVPANRIVTPRKDVVVHRSHRLAITTQPGRLPPQTTPEETVLDLAQTALTIEEAYGWIARAVNSRRTNPKRLLYALSRRRRVRWRQLLREGLGDIAAGARSVLELRYLRDVERAHGLPTGQRQVSVVQNGGRNFLDIRYSQFRTRVELDGLAAHPTDRRFRDMRRDNAGVVAGDTPLRYGTADVIERPCDLARQVATVLRRNGWDGTPHACTRDGCSMITLA